MAYTSSCGVSNRRGGGARWRAAKSGAGQDWAQKFVCISPKHKKERRAKYQHTHRTAPYNHTSQMRFSSEIKVSVTLRTLHIYSKLSSLLYFDVQRNLIEE